MMVHGSMDDLASVQSGPQFDFARLEKTRLTIRDTILDVLAPNNTGGFGAGGYVSATTAGLTESSFLLELLIVVLSEQPVIRDNTPGITLLQDIASDSHADKSDAELQVRLGDDMYVLRVPRFGTDPSSMPIRSVKTRRAACIWDTFV